MYLAYSSKRAEHYLKKLDNHINIRIKEGIDKLSENPYPTDSKFLGRDKNERVFRVRVGDYRILYEVFENEKKLLIVDIDKRPRVYKDKKYRK